MQVHQDFKGKWKMALIVQPFLEPYARLSSIFCPPLNKWKVDLDTPLSALAPWALDHALISLRYNPFCFISQGDGTWKHVDREAKSKYNMWVLFIQNPTDISCSNTTD